MSGPRRATLLGEIVALRAPLRWGMRRMPAEAPDPIRLPDELWLRPDVLDMCRRRDATALLRLANSSKYRISQGRIAYWIGTESGEVNKLINGKAGKVLRLDRWERIADLAAARQGDEEPGWVFFFGEASLAHETACALRDLGDLDGATREFKRSVRTRQSATFTRTHAVTLGYLGAVQARSDGGIEEACATWSIALDVMEGVRSGRTRQLAAEMRSVLGPVRGQRIQGAEEVHARAASYLGAAA